ncbi:4-oxalomesaconate tautomerase [Entomohabitans teleogrylli]|uniref:4-oxalomesaconate tautomerase n=1 Tax=Entomohabitans teleogrylli TaxID=1384589 RepID=UPI00073D7338|nr:4-oxalomesaconate tautomerase [Entomohabitans teleogrylli]
MHRIPCVLMRGGTSKGVLLLLNHLPLDQKARDEILTSIMGSGHELEIDGIGGGSPQTSKVAIVGPSKHPDADIDYLFAQVSVQQRHVDTTPNCGNMLCAVGPFAIEHGLVRVQDPVTRVRIRNVNTNTFVDADVQTPGGHVTYEGDTAIDGVPGRAAPIGLTFLNAAGAKTGKLLPTGNLTDTFDGVEVTCLDMAMPMVMIRAEDLGRSGQETPKCLDADPQWLQRLETIRRLAGKAMGLGDVSDKVIPKPVLLSPALHGGTLSVRYFMPHSCHKALAITGAIGLATACVLPGTVAQKLVGGGWREQIFVEHPSGQIQVNLDQPGDRPENIRASVVRTARKILTGEVYLPDYCPE